MLNELKEWVITGDLTVPSCKGADNAYLVVELTRGQHFSSFWAQIPKLRKVANYITFNSNYNNNTKITKQHQHKKTVNEIENNNSIWFTTYLFHNYHQCIQLHIHTCSYLHHLCNFLHSRMDHFHSHQYLYVYILAIKIYFNIFLFCNQASKYFEMGFNKMTQSFSYKFVFNFPCQLISKIL